MCVRVHAHVCASLDACVLTCAIHGVLVRSINHVSNRPLLCQYVLYAHSHVN